MFFQDDLCGTFEAIKRADHWANKMESSRRYLLQAEIEYWHEMLRLNRQRVSEKAIAEMRSYLRKAIRDLNSMQFTERRIAA